MTVRREAVKGKQEPYWYAYRKRHGTVAKVYLGRSADLTAARLTATAQHLDARQPPRRRSAASLARLSAVSSAPEAQRTAPPEQGQGAPPCHAGFVICDHTIEEGFGQSKGEVGLAQYAVRGGQAWHRQITLCLLAHAALAVLCAAGRRAEEAAKRGGLRAGQSSSR